MPQTGYRDVNRGEALVVLGMNKGHSKEICILLIVIAPKNMLLKEKVWIVP